MLVGAIFQKASELQALKKSSDLRVQRSAQWTVLLFTGEYKFPGKTRRSFQFITDMSFYFWSDISLSGAGPMLWRLPCCYTNASKLQCFLRKMFFNRPVIKNPNKGENLQGEGKNEVTFLGPLLYFDPKQLFNNVSVTNITNVYYQGSLGMQIF
jgi:hypothetical protein